MSQLITKIEELLPKKEDLKISIDTDLSNFSDKNLIAFGYLQALSDIKQTLPQILKTVELEIGNEIAKTLQEFANTPLDKRKTGWDWIMVVKERIINLLK